MAGTARNVSRTLSSPSSLSSLSSLSFLGASFFARLSLFALFGCGAPASEGVFPPSPAAPALAEVPTTTATSPKAAASPPMASAQTNAEATPSSDGLAWPLGPIATPEERKAQLERLAKDAGPLKTNWTPPGKSERYGHAEGLIDAPYDVVKTRLLDFPRYKDLAGPKFKKVNVVDKKPDTTDIYFQLPIMKGLVTIWYVTRFGGARPVAGSGDVIEGTFVKGNIKNMQIVFTVRPGTDDKHTVLVCDLNLAIQIPTPQSILDEELRDACGDAVSAVRARTTHPAP